MKLKKFCLFIMLFFLILISFFSLSQNQDYNIVDNSIIYDNSNVFLNITPHTIYSSGYVTFELISKTYQGNVDVVWGFDTNIAKPSKAELYKPAWENVTKSYECAGEDIWFNYTTSPKYAWCWKNLTIYDTDNITIIEEKTVNIFEHSFDYGNLGQKTIYWNETKYTEWIDYSSSFQKQDYSYGGMTTWYYITNVPIIQNKNYKLRAYINVLPKQGNYNGKYWVAIKPSAESIQEAIQNNHFFAGDPWWSSSYGRKKQINISENSNSHQTNYTIRLNISYDSDMQADFDDLRFVNGSENTELSYWIEEKYNSNHSIVWVKVPILTANTNTSIYMYYNNSVVTTTSNGENTFFLFDNYTDTSNMASNITAGTGYISIFNNQLNLYSNGTSNLAQINYSGINNIPYYFSIKILNLSIDAPSKYTVAGLDEEWFSPMDIASAGGSFFNWRTSFDIPSANIFKNFPTNWYVATPSRPKIMSFGILENLSAFIYEDYILNATNATFEPLNISNNFQIGDTNPDNFHGGNMTIDWFFVTYNWTYPEPTYIFGQEILIDITPPTFSQVSNNRSGIYHIPHISVDFNATDVGGSISSFQINYTEKFNISSNDGVLQNITSLGVGFYNINVSVNDTSNNFGFLIYTVEVNQSGNANVTIYIDGLTQNKSVNSGTNVWLNATRITGDSSAYIELFRNQTRINNGTSPVVNLTNFTALGDHNITAYYEETLNYSSLWSYMFFVNVTDTNAPELNITFPLNNTNHSTSTLRINYTIIDTNLNSVWWTNNSGRTNWTLPNGVNITNQTWADGNYLITVYGKDTSNNEGYDTVNFTIDIVNPIVVLNLPSNNTGDSDGNITFIYNATDTENLINCSLFTNSVINQTNTSITRSVYQNFTLSNLGNQSLTWYVNCIDSSLNTGNSATWTVVPVIATNFSGNTTDLSRVNISNITNLVVEIPNYGQINFTENIDLSNSTNLNEVISITSTSISVESENATMLNKSAKITFYNITMKKPEIYKDNQPCDVSICKKESFIGIVFKFNVTHFSTYTLQEAWESVGGGGGGSAGSMIVAFSGAEIIEVARCGDGKCEGELESFFAFSGKLYCPDDCGGLNYDGLVGNCFLENKEKCLFNQAPTFFYIGIISVSLIILTLIFTAYKKSKKKKTFIVTKPLISSKRKWLR